MVDGGDPSGLGDGVSSGAAPKGSAARRVIGGTLMASGLATAAFFALVTAWFAIQVTGEFVRHGFAHPADAWPVLSVTARGGLAVGACALLAWLGRLILGPRAPA